MSQRAKILAETWGYRGSNVTSISDERPDGRTLTPIEGFVPSEVTIIRHVERRWTSRCANCGAITGKVHEHLEPRRWRDLPWASRAVQIEYAPVRVTCKRCKTTNVEHLAGADPYPRQTQRYQQLPAQTAGPPRRARPRVRPTLQLLL